MNLTDSQVLYKWTDTVSLDGMPRSGCLISVWDEAAHEHGDLIGIALTNSYAQTPRHRLVDSWNACRGIPTDVLEEREQELREVIRDQLGIAEMDPNDGHLPYGLISIVGQTNVIVSGQDAGPAYIIGHREGCGDDAAALVVIEGDPAKALEKARRLVAASRVCVDAQLFFNRIDRRQRLLDAINVAKERIGDSFDNNELNISLREC